MNRRVQHSSQYGHSNLNFQAASLGLGFFGAYRTKSVLSEDNRFCPYIVSHERKTIYDEMYIVAETSLHCVIAITIMELHKTNDGSYILF